MNTLVTISASMLAFGVLFTILSFTVILVFIKRLESHSLVLQNLDAIEKLALRCCLLVSHTILSIPLLKVYGSFLTYNFLQTEDSLFGKTVTMFLLIHFGTLLLINLLSIFLSFKVFSLDLDIYQKITRWLVSGLLMFAFCLAISDGLESLYHALSIPGELPGFGVENFEKVR